MRTALQPCLKRFQASSYRLIFNWPAIVGEDLAHHCRFVSVRKQSNGKRLLTISSIASAAPLVQMQTPQVIARCHLICNETIDQVRVMSGYNMPYQSSRKPKALPREAANTQYTTLVDTIDHPGLKEALSRLARHMPNPIVSCR